MALLAFVRGCWVKDRRRGILDGWRGWIETRLGFWGFRVTCLPTGSEHAAGVGFFPLSFSAWRIWDGFGGGQTIIEEHDDAYLYRERGRRAAAVFILDTRVRGYGPIPQHGAEDLMLAWFGLLLFWHNTLELVHFPIHTSCPAVISIQQTTDRQGGTSYSINPYMLPSVLRYYVLQPKSGYQHPPAPSPSPTSIVH